jgi:preprotein translocase subunit SecD
MLDHDDLLPLEQANPTVLQSLKTHYQLTEDEAQVLPHVHERLTHFSGTLPLAQTSAAQTRKRPLQFAQPPFSAANSLSSNKKMRYLEVLVAVLIVMILASSLAFTFGIIHSNRIGSSTSVGSMGNGSSNPTIIQLITLVPAQTHPQPSQQLQTTRTILYQRLVSDGFKGANVQLSTLHNQPVFNLALPNFSDNQKDMLDILIEKGQLDFWGTGKQTPMVGDTFDPRLYTQYNPDGLPIFTGADLNPNSLTVTQDPHTNHFVINMAFQDTVTPKFTHYTASHIGDTLTVTEDGTVITSPTIMSSIDGPFQLSTNYDQTETQALVSVLKYGPLPIALKKA